MQQKEMTMGGRYLVTGVQIGMLKVLIEKDPDSAKQELEKIQNEQYIGESDSDVLQEVKEIKGE